MINQFDEFHTPPPPGDLDLEQALPFIEFEARRQVSAFYPVLDKDAERRTSHVIQAGIMSMMKRGAARLEVDQILFWNPVRGHFQPYDDEYNKTMLAFMRDFKTRYQRGMQLKAEFN